MLSHATVPNSVHIGEREGNNTSGRAGVNLTVSVDVSLLVHGAAPGLPTPASMAYWTIGMYGVSKRDCRWRCVSESIKELQTVRCVGCSWDFGFLLPILLGIWYERTLPNGVEQSGFTVRVRVRGG